MLATLLDAGNSRNHPARWRGIRQVANRQQDLSSEAAEISSGVKLSFEGKLEGRRVI
jgi:hypothetical protein